MKQKTIPLERIQSAYRYKRFSTYKPKLNKKRVGIWGSIAVISAVVPFILAPVTVPLAIRQALK